MAAFLTRALDLPTVTGDTFRDDDGSVFESDIESLAAGRYHQGLQPTYQ